ncbi:DNA cytosine methyltransferase [Candidatus Viridilinea mediisalina]|uniref:Cytosine-specific methyltransferase n=1 Tax=Candidatus Viridilinea mediisalina TaxID=2024553 RepID=A0A2A6RKW0_9CHLR|nr:DNA cytosine methyltransferase [Candidatus Viridilinea mediisalina]PDW03754.1 hypothetical protein CJ255_07180 [Candidatus Viridilinea mediisalina]
MIIKSKSISSIKKPVFIDVFAGAGGLSLGLFQSGWNGLFAIEKSSMAFETLKYNLINQTIEPSFQWPEWLPIEPFDIEDFMRDYTLDINEKLQDIDLLAGGPPCQGFSSAGRRRRDDERNLLFEKYLEFVAMIKPKMILIENVLGFAASFTKTERGGEQIGIDEETFNADQLLKRRLTEMNFVSFSKQVMSKDFGVPQLRPRYILIAIRNDLFDDSVRSSINPFEIMKNLRVEFLTKYGLPVDDQVTLFEAISDLELRHGHEMRRENQKKPFRFGKYGVVSSKYQEIMRRKKIGEPISDGVIANSHRFANHSSNVITRFEHIIRNFRPGIQLKEKDRKQLDINKHRVALLAANQVCYTLTSLPDDLIHYCEPRIPTVREYARIQSFPDWFEFKSNYTTGGDRRQMEIPRYTQVANAVPPLLAEILGLTLIELLQNRLTAGCRELTLQ